MPYSIRDQMEGEGIREQQRKEVGPQAYADGIEFWSLSAYHAYMAEKRAKQVKEAKEMTSQRRERDRQHSARHFEALKHKLDEEESMRRRGSEMRKKEDEVVMRGLDAY